MVKAYVLLKVKSGAERHIFDNLKNIKEVIEINELYGEWDIISKLELDKLGDLDSILTEKIRVIEGIVDTSTMIVAEYVK